MKVSELECLFLDPYSLDRDTDKQVQVDNSGRTASADFQF